MKKLLGALLGVVMAVTSAGAQENVFIVEPNSNTVTVSDSTTLTPLPLTNITTAGNDGGPNPIAVGAGVTSCIYDPIRKLVYIVSSSTIMVYDPLLFKQAVAAPINVPDAAGLRSAVLSQDGNWLFMTGFENIPKRAGVFQLDLNNLTDSGAKLAGGLTPGDGRNPTACEVLPASAVGGSGNAPGRLYMTVQGQLYEFDLLVSPVTPTLVPLPTTPAPVPVNSGKLTRSPDSRFILSSSTSGSGPSQWQVLRINPAVSPEVDFFNLTNPSGNAGNSIDDILFQSGGGPPFHAVILGVDDANSSLEYFDISATGVASNHVSGLDVPFQFGNQFTNDPTGQRIFVAWNGNTSFTQGYRVYDPATSTTTFQNGTTTGANGNPTKVAFAPRPPTMQVDLVTLPAGVSTSTFQLEIQGRGFLQGSSVVRIQDNNTGPLIAATTTTVLSSSTILATFPGQGGATQQYDVSVRNNDGQVSSLNAFFTGLVANPPSPPSTVQLPPLGSGYSLLSFPQYATVGDLRAAIASQLGSYNPIFFRLFLWEGTRYFELNDAKLSSGQSIMGTGFFALSRLGDALTLAAPDVYANRPAVGGNQRVVVLEPGWNIVSQPWRNTTSATFTMLYSNLQVCPNRDLVTGTVSAAAGTLTTPSAIELVGGKYVGSATMTANRAYWIENLTGAPLYLIFNQGSVNLKAVSAAAAPVTRMPPAPPGQLGDSGGGGGGGCGLLGPEFLLVVLFLRSRGRRKLAA